MLNQSASDREQLAELLHISGEQMKYITNARAGNGLARIGSALVPFYNQMSKNSEIYKLMSTNRRTSRKRGAVRELTLQIIIISFEAVCEERDFPQAVFCGGII